MITEESKKNPQELQTEANEIYQISEQNEINVLLQELIQRRVPVHIYYNGSQSNLTTEVISIDPVLKTMMLDGYAANTAHIEFLKVESWVGISLLDSVKIQFSGGPVFNNHINEKFFLKTDIPIRMIRLQRRNFYRVNSEDDMIVSIRLFHPSGKSWHGELLDLSVGGCGIIIDDSLPVKDLSRGPIKCEVTLPNMKPFTIQTKIRTVQHIEHYKNHIRLGCETIDMNPVDAKNLQLFLIKIERSIRTSSVQ